MTDIFKINSNAGINQGNIVVGIPGTGYSSVLGYSLTTGHHSISTVNPIGSGLTILRGQLNVAPNFIDTTGFHANTDGYIYYVVGNVDANIPINSGDILYLDTDDIKPASYLADQGTKLSNQQLLHDVFLGIALDTSPSGSVRTLRFAPNGVFLFNYSGVDLQIGDLISNNEQNNGTALSNQQVTKVTNANAAIGRTVTYVNTTGVWAYIQSSMIYGGTQSIL